MLSKNNKQPPFERLAVFLCVIARNEAISLAFYFFSEAISSYPLNLFRAEKAQKRISLLSGLRL